MRRAYYFAVFLLLICFICFSCISDPVAFKYSLDTDMDGKADLLVQTIDDRVTRVSWVSPEKKTLYRAWFSEKGRLDLEWWDTDGDGVIDREEQYGGEGRPDVVMGLPE